MPPSFLVDQHGQLIDSFGGAETLLKVKGRRPTQNLLDMLGDELRTVVSGVLQRVRKDANSVRYDGVAIPGLAGTLRAARRAAARSARRADPRADLAARRRRAPSQPARRRSRCSRRCAASGGRRSAEGVDLAGMSHDRMRVLQDELSYTKENLQATIEELETANEELQATNEELVASNEELQSTNEELHSVNEELYTVNAEYQKKIAELTGLNDDMEHLLDGTDVGTMFLDRELCIRKFTPRIAEIFQVIPHDIGRPLQAFSHDLDAPTLMRRHRARAGDRRARTRRRPGTRRDAATSCASCPYRRPDRATSAARRRADAHRHLARSSRRARSWRSSPRSSSRPTTRSSARRSTASSRAGTHGAARLYGYSADEAIGRHASFLWPSGQKEEIESALAEACATAGAVERLETTRVRKDGSRVDVSVTFSPILERIAGARRHLRDLARHHAAGRAPARRSPSAKSASACCSTRPPKRSTAST